MPEQKKKVTSDTTKVESPKIPNVAYPLKPRSNTTNLSQQYFNHLAGDESARFLFNRYYVAVAQRFNRLKTLKSLLKF
ncbi:hypothetical protein [Haemophilus parainfluenzae]|uniref:hypothetical protein n=1 Tax=Haemophilus parainfluenzae TaxID=729 RepID=UPI0024DFB96C|nr:hypothetical protein [Haemophilus parainfluenzae]WIF09581.1 hypothetical protein QMA14_05645 [Haemophilus parainfluenzae]